MGRAVRGTAICYRINVSSRSRFRDHSCTLYDMMHPLEYPLCFRDLYSEEVVPRDCCPENHVAFSVVEEL